MFTFLNVVVVIPLFRIPAAFCQISFLRFVSSLLLTPVFLIHVFIIAWAAGLYGIPKP